jgi:hypothetical protein
MRPTPCEDLRLAISHAELLLRDARVTDPGEVDELEQVLEDHKTEYAQRRCTPSLKNLYFW